MNLNLSSQIALMDIPQKFYNPTTAVERSEMTRMEKVPTDIFPNIEQAVIHIADAVVKEILTKQNEGKFCILGLGTGTSLTPVYRELIRRHKEDKISFSNVVVFNAYEYFPLKDSKDLRLHAVYYYNDNLESHNLMLGATWKLNLLRK